jgi:hypothetical protein
MSDKFIVSTSSNSPSLLDIAAHSIGMFVTLGGCADDPQFSGSYKTEITDTDGNVIATGYGDNKGSSVDDAYTNM